MISRLKSQWRNILAIVLLAGVVFWIAGTALARSVPLPDRLQFRDSRVVTYRDGSAAHVFLSSDQKWRIHVDLTKVDTDYIDALIRFEDKRFWNHWGVDTLAISRAVFLNVTSGRRVSGASTITMQLVRLLEPRPRTYASKVIEALRAAQLESRMTKREILEAYLRFAPYGRNIEGIESASMAYFGHRASNLSPDEIATLLAIPQAPNSRYPKASNLKRLKEARDDIAARMLEENVIPRGEGAAKLDAKGVHEVIVNAPVPQKLRAFPREIPHVAFWLAKRAPNQRHFETTIDRGLQITAENVLERYREDTQTRDIQHASIVLADHRAHEIRALVGNFDFSAAGGSQIPAFNVLRSPGSLLKPIIYAMAIDAGLALPEFLVEDVPMQAGTYTPANYDGRYSGLVRLDSALSRSLNIPFVKLLQSLGVAPFLSTLRHLGVEHLRPEPGYYGLTAAIGGVEITPLEVAGMYATLAQGGVYEPLRFQPADESEEEEQAWRVFSDGASWLTRKTLSLRDRPGFSGRRLFNPNAGKIHWKTGTSFGNRDAWSAGSGEHFTAVVWMGNLDNTPSNALVGAKRAGPVLFDMLEAVEFEDPTRPGRPSDLVEVKVCSYSGHLPSPACEHTKTIWSPEQSVPIERCPYHHFMDIHDETGLALSPACRAGQPYTQKSFVKWPASVRRYLKDHARQGAQSPPWAPGCHPVGNTAPPNIVSPPHGQAIVLMRGVDPKEQEVPLEADVADSNEELSWFVDGEFLKTVHAHERVWWTPSRGKHDIVVMDQAGRSSRRKIQVR